ncbi:hypothetical protein HanIR_Chr01g0023711 [Helianthus annuus]|nr:hypothetical protein HanIR_Chr01g0023711 [Helianthus annuus]
MISGWCIWLMWNEVAFNQKVASVSKVITNIKVFAYLWVKNQMKKKVADCYLWNPD